MTRHKSYCLSLAVVIFLALASSSGYAQPVADFMSTPQMTSAQVIQIAQDFCRKIGLTVSVPATAIFPYSTFPGELNDSWLPQWEVKFPDQADVLIADGTGVVMHCTNTAYFARIDISPRPARPYHRRRHCGGHRTP